MFFFSVFLVQISALFAKSEPITTVAGTIHTARPNVSASIGTRDIDTRALVVRSSRHKASFYCDTFNPNTQETPITSPLS